MKLIIATGNKGKLREVRALLESFPIDILSIADYPDMPEIIEDGETFIENALIKARTVARHTGLPALADDSGLVVDALDGAPGVRSARFAPTTEERNRKLLDMMRDVPDNKRTARFVCALALVMPDGAEWTTEGACEGLITREQSGAEGFGYDPVFHHPPSGTTFAELSPERKNEVSHRGRALAAFKAMVETDGFPD